jgi:hypothetical protein
MANHGLMIPSKVVAADVDAYVRSVKSASDLDNGNVVSLSALSVTAGEGEVWTAATPATGAGLTNLWMIGEPEVVLTDSKYKNIDPNPLNFYTPAGKIATAFKLQVGDIVMLNAEALAGTKSTNNYVVATNATTKLTWAAAAVSGVSLYLLGTEYVSLPTTGAIGEDQRVVAYKFHVVAIA